jgi:mannosidase alpha-like ER degradation enhancer 2
MLHVCKSSHHLPQLFDGQAKYLSDSSIWNVLAMSKSDANAFNETVLASKELIGFYRWKTTADPNLKLSADMLTSLHTGLPPMPQTRVHANLKLIKEMFTHAYDSYMYNGFPAPEVRPITCQQATFDLVKIPGLTLIDSLDSLVVFGNYTEFARSVERLRHLNTHISEEIGLFNGGGLFAINQNVSLFETNIRILGGLLSAHQLANAFLRSKVFEHDVRDENGAVLIGAKRRRISCDNGYSTAEIGGGKNCRAIGDDCDESTALESILCRNETSSYWEYDGFLLDMARDIGERLLPAFDTQTGIPFGTVNLLSGVPKSETTIASLAGGGTLSLEMELLSRLTGEERFGRAAKLAARALWMRRAPNDLLGKHICTRRGEWTETLSGIGSNSDSFYEYLMKHHILFPEDDDFWTQLVSAYGGVHKESRLGEWYADVEMTRGGSFGGGSRRVFEALMAFYPGLQVLLGETTPAARTLNSFFLVREHLGFLPERFNYGMWKVDTRGGAHLLRPELLESAYFLHRASKGMQQKFKQNTSGHISREDSSSWQWAGDFALHAIESLTRTKCGYASPEDVSISTTGSLLAKQHHVKFSNEMPSYFLSETLKYLYLLFDDENPLNVDEELSWVFTTEAHPVHYEKKQSSNRHVRRLEMSKRSLQQRIQTRLAGAHSALMVPLKGLRKEKWTHASNYEGFFQQLEPVTLVTKEIYDASRMVKDAFMDDRGYSFQFVERFLPGGVSSREFDCFNELGDGANAAILSFSTLGREAEVSMSCPNLYKADFLWIRALNGGTSDYSDVYISRVQDEVTIPQNRASFVGSVDAVALDGAGIHVDAMHGTSSCPSRISSNCSVKKVQRSNGTRSKTWGDYSNSHTQLEISDLGSFEVSAFPDGNGFFIQHVESGEALMMTLIDDGSESTHSSDTFFLVYSNAGRDPSSRRSIVMANTQGQSFSCAVHIIDMSPEVSKTSVCERDKNIETWTDSASSGDVIAQLPCAPALFGPASMHNLRQVGTIEVQAALQPPTIGKEYGCSESKGETQFCSEHSEKEIAGEPVCDTKVVSMVHRGMCAFQEKAINQKETLNAEGVIVVNSEDELFVMSGNENPAHDQIPVTVLISRSDGARLIEILHSSKNQQDLQLQARISLVQAQVDIKHSLKDSVSVVDNQFLPSVKSSTELLQIFSPSGWGVQATRRPTLTGEMEWQLLLLTHGD